MIATCKQPIMPRVAPYTLHNAWVKCCAQLEVEYLFIGPLTGRWLFFFTVVLPGIFKHFPNSRNCKSTFQKDTIGM